MEELKNTDLDIIYSHWKAASTKIHFLLPPLVKNQTIQGLQIKSKSNISRIDFKLMNDEGKLIFYDLITDRKFDLDLSNVDEGKIKFFKNDSFEDTWERLPLEDALKWTE
jgi:hypothetical protein